MPKRLQKPSGAIVWHAEQLRTTIFPNESPLTLNLLDIWKQLRSDEPDEFSIKPTMQKIEKEMDDRNFLIVSSVDRIHFQMMPSIPSDNPGGLFAESHELKKMLPIFEAMVEPWLMNDKNNNIIRLAAGGVHLAQVKSRKEGYQRLEAFLPAVQIDADNSRDFQYQINRRRDSKTGEEDSYFNRISKWSVVKSKTVIIDETGTVNKEIFPTKFACRLAIDISTPHDNEMVFNRGLIVPLSHELHELGIEITDNGDIA